MTDAMLKKGLDDLLRADLKKRGHVETGSLYKSINFIVVNGKIALEANDYIQYLDDRTFLYSFFKSNAFLSLIGDYVSDEIVEDINKKV
jgi:hypothetical protein